ELIEKATKEALARETKAVANRKDNAGGFGFPGGFGPTPNLKAFIEKRTTAVTAQLEGKSKGNVPGGFGFGPPPGGPGGPGGPGVGAPRQDAVVPGPLRLALQ